MAARARRVRRARHEQRLEHRRAPALALSGHEPMRELGLAGVAERFGLPGAVDLAGELDEERPGAARERCDARRCGAGAARALPRGAARERCPPAARSPTWRRRRPRPGRRRPRRSSRSASVRTSTHEASRASPRTHSSSTRSTPGPRSMPTVARPCGSFDARLAVCLAARRRSAASRRTARMPRRMSASPPQAADRNNTAAATPDAEVSGSSSPRSIPSASTTPITAPATPMVASRIPATVNSRRPEHAAQARHGERLERAAELVQLAAGEADVPVQLVARDAARLGRLEPPVQLRRSLGLQRVERLGHERCRHFLRSTRSGVKSVAWMGGWSCSG